MPRISASQSLAFQKIRDLAAGSSHTPKMGQDMMTALDSAIGWDGYRLFGIDPNTLLINRLLAASDNDATARWEWLTQVYLADDTVPYIELPKVMKARLKE